MTNLQVVVTGPRHYMILMMKNKIGRKPLKAKDGLIAVLERHGIVNAAEYLEKNGANAKVSPSSAPDVRIRGSIHLMKKQKISRSELIASFSKLKYL